MDSAHARRKPSPDAGDLPFEPLGDDRPEGTVFVCPLCGSRFTHAKQSCGSCPLNTGCRLVTCPSCGYGFPRSSAVVDWLRRLVARGRGRKR